MNASDAAEQSIDPGAPSPHRMAIPVQPVSLSPGMETSDVLTEDSEPIYALPPEAPAEVKLIGRKASAFVIAILVHAALLALMGLIVVLVPEPPIAELTGYVAPSATPEQAPVQKVVPTQSTPPSPVSSATQMMTAVGVSSVSLPEFEFKDDAPTMEVTTMDLGAGFTSAFAPKGTSAVEFFGIKSQGKRVAFLIDVDKRMLTDTRGGYPAYEIVKNEIAGMIGKLGLDTAFNVILFEGNIVSAYSEKMIPATSANKTKIKDWLDPVNREFEKLGIRAIQYPVQNLQGDIPPIPAQNMTSYMRGIQFALESDVDAVFIITYGYAYLGTQLPKDQLDKKLKEMNWTTKDDQALVTANQKAKEWLEKENAARRAKGIPERVVTSMHEVLVSMNYTPMPRYKPGSVAVPAETREEQIENATRLLYTEKGKPKPQINFVIFIGKDEDKDTVPQFEHFQRIAKKARNGKALVLQGLAALKNVTGR